MLILPIKASQAYTIYLGHHVLQQSLATLLEPHLQRRMALIVDEQLAATHALAVLQQLQAVGLRAELLICPSGEHQKTRETKHMLEDLLLTKRFGRDSCFLALGGGMLLDLVGFLAATYCRGVPVIYLPTTLLAMVDASIGGKTAVNTRHGKNLIGSVTPPAGVLMECGFLATLPEPEYRNGVVEMLKHALLADAELFAQMGQCAAPLLAQDPGVLLAMVGASCRIKQAIVEQDEHEQHARFLLNLGHTIGHAIEICEGYQVSHGEAVAIGLLVEGYLSHQCGMLPKADFDALQQTLKAYGLPLRTRAFHDLPAFYQSLGYDKKALHHKPQFVLLDAIGKPHHSSNGYLMQVKQADLASALAWASTEFAEKSLC